LEFNTSSILPNQHPSLIGGGPLIDVIKRNDRRMNASFEDFVVVVVVTAAATAATAATATVVVVVVPSLLQRHLQRRR
jgi:hypothetical protein